MSIINKPYWMNKELKSVIKESLEKTNEELMKTRICFIRNIMEKENVDYIILLVK